MAAELKPIDVICQPSRDGKITPMKIRVIDEDGEYQEYKIKGYNIIRSSPHAFHLLPYRQSNEVHSQASVYVQAPTPA